MNKLWIVPCLTAVLMAADVSGTWAGNIEVEDPTGGDTIDTPVRAEFRQQAETISGTIGRRDDQGSEAIRNAKLAEGKHLTFEVSSPDGNGSFKFELTVEGDRMEGQMSGSVDSGPITGKVHLSRAPAPRANP
jgi:hypothetical protein